MRALRLLAWLLAALTGAAGPRPPLHTGDHWLSVRHDGRERRYLVHVPPVASGRALPVLLSFHGAGGTAAGQQRFTGTDAVADREGFLVVYPEGTNSGGLLVWNAGTCCGPAVAGRVDDVGFALAIVDDIARRTAVDPHRLYATGMSNGAMMAHRLAAEASTRIAAIAPVAGGLVYQRFAPARPVPVLHIHSLDDPIALYRGGLGRSLAGNERMNPDVDKMMVRWAAADGCRSGPQVRAERRDARGHTARLFAWSGCAGGSEVRLWQLTGAGHVWPGQQLGRGLRLLGTPTTVIDANEEIWRFVSRFRR
ncbi:MAG TPA: PHB depolymerase family esterase [Thermoanaerobaculia bacterium]|jgi:polyhydroxybutyrate depolymerase|nr:PHB depolymerase family esterase [Thermoanaerobaculia bacterium]